jgi:hypothetical protein
MTPSRFFDSKPGAIAGYVTGMLPYANCLGRVWYSLLIFRVIILAIGSEAYTTAKTVKCATEQPLCQNVCSQQFMPVSIPSLWTSQLVSTGVLAIIFSYGLKTPTENFRLLAKLKAADESNFAHPSEKAARSEKIAELEGRYLDAKIRQKYKNGVMVTQTKNTKLTYALLQWALLSVEILFLVTTVWLLKQQYHYETPWTELLKTGEILATPPVYTCKINRSRFLDRDTLERARKLGPTNPAFPYWKATFACAQADAICNIPNFVEMTVINYCMIGAGMLAVTTLILNSVQSLFVILRASTTSMLTYCKRHFESPTV